MSVTVVARAEYRRLLTQAYDIDKPDAPEQELAYYRGLIGDGPVLEAMSGSGRFLVPLLQDGLDIDGMDASPDMLAACREKCARLGLSISLELEALETFTPTRTYELIFCGGGSFGLIVEPADVAAALARLHGALRSGGRLALEVETPIVTRRGAWSGRWWRRSDGALIVLRDVSRSTREGVEEAVGIYELFVDGVLVETELNEWVRRFWTADEITTALDAAGFVAINVTEAFGSGPPAEDSDMLSVTAVRP